MKLYILRHGQSEGNVSGIGGLDPVLTEVGINQIAMAADRLKSVNIDQVYCSPLYRALQSAGIVRNYIGKTPMIHPCFCEVWGENWNAKPVEELQQSFTWAGFPDEMHGGQWWPNKAESMADIYERAKTALNMIANNHINSPENILLIGHANMQNAMIHALCDYPYSENIFISHRNGSLTMIDWTNEYKHFVMINDVAHLPPHFWT